MTRSRYGKINFKDVTHGFLVAFGAAFLTGLTGVMAQGKFPGLMDIKSTLPIGLAAGVSYILKKVFQNSDGKLLKPEKPTRLE